LRRGDGAEWLVERVAATAWSGVVERDLYQWLPTLGFREALAAGCGQDF